MLLLVQCFHCPADVSRWATADPEASVREHVRDRHPATGDWVRADDWEVLIEADVTALDVHVERLQAGESPEQLAVVSRSAQTRRGTNGWRASTHRGG